MQKTTKKRWLMFAVFCFAALIVVGLILWKANAPQGTAGAKSYTFTVVDAEGGETVHKLSTDEEFLGAALQNEGLIEGEEGEFGLFVKTVGGITANEAEQEWWALYVGDEMAQSGVDTTPVEDGGEYSFRLTVGW